MWSLYRLLKVDSKAKTKLSLFCVLCLAGGVLLRHLPVLHAVYPVFPWSHFARSHRWDPFLHHPRFQQTNAI